MSKVFITGISGLLGTNLANELLDRDHTVYAVLRNADSYTGKRTEKLILIEMDLFSDYSGYLKKCETVIHIAAETSTWLINYYEYEKVNYHATVRLFKMAKTQKVGQFIFISTANTVGYGNESTPGCEGMEMKKPFSESAYAISKHRAEEYLLKNQQQVELKILNPTFMIGPYDRKPSSGKIILMSLHKRLVFYPPGGKNFVPVKDVVSSIISSLTKGRGGEKYLIAGENITYKDFFLKIKKIEGRRQLLLPIPQSVLYLLGLAGNLLRKLNIETSLSSANMKVLCIKNFYCNRKSIQELKVSYTSIDLAITEAISYFKTVSNCK